MSTWISRPLIVAALLAGLAGCVTTGTPEAGRSASPFGAAVTGAAPARAAAVMGGAVKIAGPEGFCVDRASSRIGGAAPFVLLAPCERIRSGVAGLILRPRVLLTATVTEGPGPTDSGYLRFFSEPEGLAALSATGNGAGLEVERMETAADGSFRVTVTEDAAPDRAGMVDGRSWRAFFAVNGHLVAASLRSPREAPMSAERAAALLDGFVAAIRAASTPADRPAQG